MVDKYIRKADVFDAFKERITELMAHLFAQIMGVSMRGGDKK